MILPLLAPLLGSLLGPTLFGSLGMAPWMAGALGSGLASLAVTRDPKQALLSGLTAGAMSGIGGLLNGASNAAVQTASNTAANAGGNAALQTMRSSINPNVIQAAANQGMLGGGLGSLAGASPAPMTDAMINGIRGAGAPAGNGLGEGVLGWVRQHPYMTAGLLAAPALLPQPSAPVKTEENKDIPEHFPTVSGPQRGYNALPGPRMAKDMTAEDYRTYGRNTSVDPREAQFLGQPELVAPPAPPPTGGGSTSQDDYFSRLARRFGWQRTPAAYANGGLVTGPGGPTDDLIQAEGPGGEPIRLSDGEYVMPAQAVNNAGGPEAMDRLRARLLAIAPPDRDRNNLPVSPSGRRHGRAAFGPFPDSYGYVPGTNRERLFRARQRLREERDQHRSELERAHFDETVARVRNDMTRNRLEEFVGISPVGDPLSDMTRDFPQGEIYTTPLHEIIGRAFTAAGMQARDELLNRQIRRNERRRPRGMKDGGTVGDRIMSALQAQMSEQDPAEGMSDQPRRRLVLNGSGVEAVEELPTRYERDMARRSRASRDPNSGGGLSGSVDGDSVTLRGRWRTKTPQ